MLCPSGEKHARRFAGDSSYHVMERAYGAIRRSIRRPCALDADRAQANYRDGVLTVRLPKAADSASRFAPVA